MAICPHCRQFATADSKIEPSLKLGIILSLSLSQKLQISDSILARRCNETPPSLDPHLFKIESSVLGFHPQDICPFFKWNIFYCHRLPLLPAFGIGHSY